jgi:hypothetical protein
LGLAQGASLDALLEVFQRNAGRDSTQRLLTRSRFPAGSQFAGFGG